MAYRVFTRVWWKANSSWPNGLEPHLGRKRHICTVPTEEEARAECVRINETINPGKYGRKAEYERV